MSDWDLQLDFPPSPKTIKSKFNQRMKAFSKTKSFRASKGTQGSFKTQTFGMA
jgi:hypothetical protein